MLVTGALQEKMEVEALDGLMFIRVVVYLGMYPVVPSIE